MPRSVEMLLQSVADSLHDLAAIAARQVDESLDPKDIVQTDRGAQAGE